MTGRYYKYATAFQLPHLGDSFHMSSSLSL
jgi:hypothetical protein